MRKGFGKSIIGGVVACLTMVSMCAPAYAADNEVKVTQDNITVTKTANWTTLNGKTIDSNGNPYIKVDFKIDTTKADIKPVPGGPADIVLVIDNTASYEDRFDLAKKAARAFAEEIMAIETNEVKVGLVEFGNQSYINQEITNDKAKVLKAIDDLKIDSVRNGTNMHYGVYNAQKMLEKSGAESKIMIILSDGEPNRIMGNDKHDEVNGMNYTTKQLQEANKVIKKGVKVVTIGYCNKKSALEFIRSIASRDASGNQMFYTADTVNNGIKKVFDLIREKVATIVYGNALVDKIPAECKVVEGTISVNDNNITPSLLKDKNLVEFNWVKNKLEKKVYEVSLVMTLDKTKLTDKQLSGEEMINTNGETIDVKIDSKGSSSFAYEEKGIIELTSPKLSLKDANILKEDNENKEDTTEKEELKEEIVENDDTYLDSVPDTGGDSQDMENDDNQNGDKEDITPDTGDAFNNIVILGIVVSGLSVIIIRALEKRKYKC